MNDDPTEEVIKREIRRAREILREDRRRAAPSDRVGDRDAGSSPPGDPPDKNDPPVPADGDLGKGDGNPKPPPRKEPPEPPRRSGFWWGDSVDQ